MIIQKVVLVVGLILSFGHQAQAVQPSDCGTGQSTTITAKIVSVVARDTAWSVWVKGDPTGCPVAAVVVSGDGLGASCRPGSHITATGTIDADSLKSDAKSVSCVP
jgi:hypothetical protein